MRIRLAIAALRGADIAAVARPPWAVLAGLWVLFDGNDTLTMEPYPPKPLMKCYKPGCIIIDEKTLQSYVGPWLMTVL